MTGFSHVMRKPDGRHWSCGASQNSLCGGTGTEHEHCDKNRHIHWLWSTSFDKVVTYITRGPWGWNAWFWNSTAHNGNLDAGVAILRRIVRQGVTAVPPNLHDRQGRRSEQKLLYARIFMGNGILDNEWVNNNLPIANGFIQFLDPGEPAVMERLRTTELFARIQELSASVCLRWSCPSNYTSPSWSL